jgi:putative ABC transport system permease protein
VRVRALDPIWRKAPLLLVRFPQIALAVAVGAFILAATAAARPGYLASSGRAALAREIGEFSRWHAGLRVTRFGSLSDSVNAIVGGDPVRRVESDLDVREVPLPRTVEQVRTRLAQIAAPVGDLDDPVVSMAGSPLRASRPGQTADAQARLAYRDGWRENVTVVAGGGSDGVWVSDVTARQIDVSVGDTVALQLGPRVYEAPVAAVYRDLALGGYRDAWAPLSELVYKAPNADTYPPPLVLAPRARFFAAAAELRDSGQVQWNVPVRRGPFSLDKGEALARTLSRVIANHLTSYDSDLLAALGTEGFFPTERHRSSAMNAIVFEAHEQVAALRAPVDVVSIAAAAVAAAILVAAGYFLVQRRRVEFASLVQRGVAPARLGGRVALELLVPSIAGAAVGLWGGLAIVGVLGPGRGFPGEALSEAALACAVAIAAGIALATAAAVVACRREETGWGRARPRRLRGAWEAVALIISGCALWRLSQTGGAVVSGAESRLRLDVLLLPLVGILAVGGLTMRAAQTALGAGASIARRWPPALYLATRRLANSSGTAVALVAACAFSIGVFTYASVLEASTGETARAKAYVFAGADAAALVAPDYEGVDLDFPWTYVVRFDRFLFDEGTQGVPVIGVDPDTFERAAYWQSDFSPIPLSRLMSRLEGPDDELRVVAVGDAAVPDDQEAGIEVRVVGRASVFPGQVGDEPVLVAARDRLLDGLAGEASASGRADELWMDVDAERAAAALAGAGIPYYSLRSAAAVLESPSLQSLSWALLLLRALGVGAVLLSVLGLLLYLQARERATTLTLALAGRMRFSRGSHLAMLLTENAILLGLALATGIGAGVGIVRMVLPKFDLLPSLPPGPVFSAPLFLFGVVAAGGLGLAPPGAWFSRRSTARRDIVEVLRS